MIPKVIHYCWFGKNPLPRYVKKCIKSWKKYCPNYKFICWNETNYNVKKNDFIKSAYQSKKWAFVSDYARIDIINSYGGIYLDTDVELLKSLDSLLENNAYFGMQQDGLYVNTGIGFGAIKNHPVLIKMLEHYNSLAFNLETIKELACPYINTTVLQDYGFQFKDEVQKLGDIVVYPAKYFDPLSTNASDLLCEHTYSIHHYGGAWISKKNAFKRRLYMVVGERNIIKIKKALKWKK
ncbi:MAG: exopolysaccharide biosynthesis protein [Roseburia sp.]|nr:glycosyl transferase [Anaeroplasma bactoclasticum]MCM1196271.1 exopolysaccharide biosynthesis protein [Roseburia sp.]MCM1557378.1 glycosyl transferase [Anaeroplasma bactoclasticum]